MPDFQGLGGESVGAISAPSSSSDTVTGDGSSNGNGNGTSTTSSAPPQFLREFSIEILDIKEVQLLGNSGNQGPPCSKS